MPSGFQNDTNQLQAEMYRVVVTMSNTAYYPTADGDDNGGVTPNSWDAFSTANLPTTLIKGKARARGNMRFRNIVNRLTGLADCQVRDITITEANGDAQATSLAFTVNYERPALIPLSGDITGTTVITRTAIDTSTAITTRAIAIQDAVAQGIRDATSASTRVYDPTLQEGTQVKLNVTTTGMTATQTFGTVAVTLIDESTLFD
jgi:hypothetical protein